VAIGHAVRGAASAALALIVLEAVGSDRGGRVGSFFADVSGLLAKAISPDVPLIPNRAAGTYDADGNYHPTVPGYLGGGTVNAPGADTSGQPIIPDSRVFDPAPFGQHNPAYDNQNQPIGIQE
jgi:hypothetical protein